MLPVEIIKKKRQGLELTDLEISSFIQGYLDQSVTDYQMSAFLMAVFFKGMTTSETLQLTQVMLKSGEQLDFSYLPTLSVDKHSTGGIGDKTSLILAPIVASLGIPVPMISGRGLGHTGGTLDKLESIPGFTTQLDLMSFKKMVETKNLGLIGQTPTICPADKRIYALRDVTATVESLPLICASIMSKKLAEGIGALVLDVKFGSGAFMKEYSQAKALALGLMNIAKGAQKKVAVLMTSMNQPLGQFAGNSLEVQESINILQNKKTPANQDTFILSIELAAWMIHLSTQLSLDEARSQAIQSIESGSAYRKFVEIVEAQGGQLDQLPSPRYKYDIIAKQSGYVDSFDVEKIGWLNVSIGAGRKQMTDQIEPTAGIEFHVKIGHQVKPGDKLFTVYGSQLERIKTIEHSLLQSIKMVATPTESIQLISEVII